MIDLKADFIHLPLEEEGTGTPRGNSFWESFDKCPSQYRLDKEFGDTILHTDPERRPDPARVGTLYHQLSWAYQMPHWPDRVVLREDDGRDPDWTEALRMFREYQKHYPPQEMTPVGLEDDFRIEDEDYTGVPVLTGRWDAVPKFADEDAVAVFESRRTIEVGGGTKRLNLRGPGIYILDTKSAGSKKGDIVLKYNEAIQQILYAMAWDYLHPDMPIRGTIIAHAARHNAQYVKKKQEKAGEAVTGMRPDSFTWVFVPPPDEHQQDVARDTMRRRAERWRDDPEQLGVNTAMCFLYGPCDHLESGTCDRIGLHSDLTIIG